MSEEQVAEIAKLEAAFRSAEEAERRARGRMREASIAVPYLEANDVAALAGWLTSRRETDDAWRAWQRAVRGGT